MPKLAPYDALRDTPYHMSYPGDFTGLTVLDVGADWGSSVEYFLEHGAAHVVGIDKDKTYCTRMVDNFAGDERVQVEEVNIVLPQHWTYILETYHPDVAKVDCEHCELMLPLIDPELIMTIPLWFIEVHTESIRQQVTNFFEGLGYTVETLVPADVNMMGRECSVIKCVV